MGVFVKKMMLDLPRVVIAKLVGEHDLIERLVKQARLVARMPGPRQLQLIEHAELHVATSSLKQSTVRIAARLGARRSERACRLLKKRNFVRGRRPAERGIPVRKAAESIDDRLVCRS